ncbi:hypothetical protein [Streptomyces sp. NPDC046685]|uniref:hypothetical protein n=1 Tax=Streptomyces sp. NPDC046685 TaxID=3157202 RepID=UPI0033CEDB6B
MARARMGAGTAAAAEACGARARASAAAHVEPGGAPDIRPLGDRVVVDAATGAALEYHPGA